MIITICHTACDKGGCRHTGPRAPAAEDARAGAREDGWDISELGDWCLDHKGIPMGIRGRRAMEQAEADRVLSSLRVKLGTEGSGDGG